MRVALPSYFTGDVPLSPTGEQVVGCAKARKRYAPPHLALALNGGHAALCPPYAEPLTCNTTPATSNPANGTRC